MNFKSYSTLNAILAMLLVAVLPVWGQSDDFGLEDFGLELGEPSISSVSVGQEGDSLRIAIAPELSLGFNGKLIPSETRSEPTSLPSTAVSPATADSVLDFVLSDGGGDSLTLDISQLKLGVSGTLAATRLGFMLSGPDAFDVAGTLSGGELIFSGLSISVPDGMRETYVVKAYYMDNKNLTEGQTLMLSMHSSQDITVVPVKTQMNAADTTTVSNGSGATVSIAATKLVFVDQPSPLSLISGILLDFTSDPAVVAQDAAGNIDVDYTNIITVTQSGSGAAIFSRNALVPTQGRAQFSGLQLTYNAPNESSIALVASANGLASATSALFAVNARPLLVFNVGAQIDEGGSVLIDQRALQFKDATSSNAEIEYVLSSVPQAGQLQLNGQSLAVGGTFTQKHIDSGQLKYQHDGNAIEHDTFRFVVKGKPGISSSEYSFGITVAMVDDKPRFDVVQCICLIEGETITITNGNLRALDEEVDSDQLIFTVVDGPQHGTLSLGPTFTQSDIDQLRLGYIHDGGESTNDRIVLNVRESNGSALANIELPMKIKPKNDAPDLPIIFQQDAVEGKTFRLPLKVNDAEGDAFRVEVRGLPAAATIHDNVLVWTPSFTQAGRYGVVVEAIDDRGAVTTRRFDLLVSDSVSPGLDLSLIDFGAVPVGQTVERSVVLNNTSDLPLIIEGGSELTTEVAGPFSLVADGMPIVIPPGQHSEMTVRFTPQSDPSALQAAKLSCTTSLGEIAVDVVGTCLWNQLVLDRPMVDFGRQAIGGDRRINIIAANSGNAPLQINQISSNNSEFTVSPASFALAPGEKRFVSVDYTPIDEGRKEGLLSFESEGHPPSVVPVQGMGIEAPLGQVHLDFDLNGADQKRRVAGSVGMGEIFEVQIVIDNAPLLEGWTACIEYDRSKLEFIEDSFIPSDFIPAFTGLVSVGDGYVEVGGNMLFAGIPARVAKGDGILAHLQFRARSVINQETALTITKVRLNRPEIHGVYEQTVRSAALLGIGSVAGFVSTDFDQSGYVDFNDLFLFADAFDGLLPEEDARYDLDDNGTVDFADFFLFTKTFGQQTQVAKLMVQPVVEGLQPNYPNPFNAETTLSYNIVQGGEVELTIYNMVGQQVRTLVQGRQTAGHYVISWDGRSANGEKVATGRYWAALNSNNTRYVQPMTLLK